MGRFFPVKKYWKKEKAYNIAVSWEENSIELKRPKNTYFNNSFLLKKKHPGGLFQAKKMGKNPKVQADGTFL